MRIAAGNFKESYDEKPGIGSPSVGMYVFSSVKFARASASNA
jgi:hypothetical protein